METIITERPKTGLVFLDEIREKGFTLIPFTGGALAEKVIEGYKIFLEKNGSNELFCPDRDSNDPDNGNLRRNGTFKANGVIKTNDKKNFFHYRAHYEEMLRKQNVDFEEYKEWFNDLNLLWSLCHATIMQKIILLDTKYPHLNLLEKAMSNEAMNQNVIRLLAYDAAENSKLETLAGAHTDRDFASLQVYQTHNGLFLGLSSDAMTEYIPEVGKAAFFTGKKARKFTKQGDDPSLIPAVIHFVSVNEETKKEMRYAIVFFFHIPIELTEAELDDNVSVW